MAKYEHTEEVSEMVKTVIVPEAHTITLNADELAGLRALLGYGVHWITLDKLKLRDLYGEISKDVSWDVITKENPGFERTAMHKAA